MDTLVLTGKVIDWGSKELRQVSSQSVLFFEVKLKTEDGELHFFPQLLVTKNVIKQIASTKKPSIEFVITNKNKLKYNLLAVKCGEVERIGLTRSQISIAENYNFYELCAFGLGNMIGSFAIFTFYGDLIYTLSLMVAIGVGLWCIPFFSVGIKGRYLRHQLSVLEELGYNVLIKRISPYSCTMLYLRGKSNVTVNNSLIP